MQIFKHVGEVTHNFVAEAAAVIYINYFILLIYHRLIIIMPMTAAK